MQFRKVLYRMLQAALLFWKLLPGTLMEWGFVLNPYDQWAHNLDDKCVHVSVHGQIHDSINAVIV